MNLYITADQIGVLTGGGQVTYYESEALKGLGPCEVWGRDNLQPNLPEPWGYDAKAAEQLNGKEKPKLTHFYAGTFSNTVKRLKDAGLKVTYTAAAHDIAKSKAEHEKLGLEYCYPHMTDPELFARYVEGYKNADVLICPSNHSADVMRGFGCTNRIEVIPHGCHIPKCWNCDGHKRVATGPNDITDWDICTTCNGTGFAPIAPLPPRFTVGYLGAVGPDKGLVYLLGAWKKLAYKDATLVLAGRDSTSRFAQMLVQRYGGGNIEIRGWVNNLVDFYSSISLYVQPSVTEGFGMEVLEAMAYGRPTLCSTGAGAADVCPFDTEPSVDAIANTIDRYRQNIDIRPGPIFWREEAEKYTWAKVQKRYQEVWRSLDA